MNHRCFVPILGKLLVPALVMFAALAALIGLEAIPVTAHAASDPPCLGMKPAILPNKDTLP